MDKLTLDDLVGGLLFFVFLLAMVILAAALSEG